MIPEPALKKLVEAIQSEPTLYGSVIGFHGNNQSRLLFPGKPSVAGSRMIVIVEEVVPGNSEEKKGRISQSSSTSQQILETPPPIVTNRSVVGREAVGAGLSCGLAVVSGIGVFGGAAAAPVSGGASTILVIAAWTGFVTSSLQCVNGLVRVGTAVLDPEDNDLQRWDETSIYSMTMLVVDGLGVVSSLASLPAASKNLWAALQRHGKLKQSFEAVSKMNRASRGQLVRDAIREAGKTSEGKLAIEAALKEASLTSKQVTTVMARGADTARRSKVVMGAITKDAASRLNRSLIEVLNGAAGIGVSGTPSEWTGSGSGGVYKFGSWAGKGLGNIIVHVMSQPI